MGMVTAPSAGWCDVGPPDTVGVAAAWYRRDVCLMLVRHTRLLFVRRAARGIWSLPSSGLQPGEPVADGACRAAMEQVNLIVDPSDVNLAYVLQHQNGEYGEEGEHDDPGEGARRSPRFTLFARVHRFRGIPFVADRRVLDALAWCPPSRMPVPTVPHVAAAVSAWDKRMEFRGHGPVSGGEPSRSGGVAGYARKRR